MCMLKDACIRIICLGVDDAFDAKRAHLSHVFHWGCLFGGKKLLSFGLSQIKNFLLLSLHNDLWPNKFLPRFIHKAHDLLLARLCNNLELRVPWLIQQLVPYLIKNESSNLTGQPPLCILQAILVLHHCIKQLVALKTQRLRITLAVALKNHALRQKHLEEVDRQRKADVPVQEVHQVPFCFYDVGPGGHAGRELGRRSVELLDVVDEDQSVVDFIEF